RAGEVIQPRTNQAMPPRFLGGKVPPIPAGTDRREILASWVTAPDNTFFAKSVVNRIWFHIMGRGVVDPVDDFRDSNPSANDDLRSEEHTSELQSRSDLVCRLLLEKKSRARGRARRIHRGAATLI